MPAKRQTKCIDCGNPELWHDVYRGKERILVRCRECNRKYHARKVYEHKQRQKHIAGAGWKLSNPKMHLPSGIRRVKITWGTKNKVSFYEGNVMKTESFSDKKRLNNRKALIDIYKGIGYHVVEEKFDYIMMEAALPEIRNATETRFWRRKVRELHNVTVRERAVFDRKTEKQFI
jgi:hypothetical protein